MIRNFDRRVWNQIENWRRRPQGLRGAANPAGVCDRD
jgi:hypothetical protein